MRSEKQHKEGGDEYTRETEGDARMNNEEMSSRVERLGRVQPAYMRPTCSYTTI